IGFGKTLVFADQRWRESDVFDDAGSMQFLERQRRMPFGGAAGIDGGRRNGVERRGLACANVEDARAIRVIEKVQVHLDDVIDAHKVATLLSRGEASRALEQADLPGRS